MCCITFCVDLLYNIVMFVSIVVSQDNVWALTLFGGHMYWTDQETSSIYRANKTDGTNKTTVITKLDYPYDIHMYHPDRQPDGLYSEPPTVYVGPIAYL